jgi:FkbH-like protein
VLQTGELGPEVAGGDYCGTQGEALPIHGFAVYVSEGAVALDGLFYEGVFEDGFRSRRMRSGDICVSPQRAPLTALRIGVAAPPHKKPDAAEPVRAVIWDLDETFWGGTLTEGGIFWREENADIVRSLARRGIVSSICSKNDFASILAVLEEHGMRDYFVFPSISWDPKGPRLKTLVETLQLRAPTLLFIDDNPMNRAEAENFVPGLQVQDETIVPELLDHPLLQGKPDPDMQRLAQYRLLERRRADQVQSGGDTDDFLRASGITVTIEHDLAPHLDRAIELINRTNQLNFTKNRLAEDPADAEVARRELRTLLAEYDVQAGILRVHDRYGDYGYCGLYVSQRYAVGAPFLVHFAFSCRILGMGIETWLYRRLLRPRLDVVGPVLTDVFDETREIDWIGVELPGIASVPAEAPHDLSYVLARGACDMRALSHYFSMIAGRVIEEFDTVRAGQSPLINHSLIATQAMKGIDPRATLDFLPLGFLAEDFNTILAGDAPAGPAVWVLGFTIEQPATVYRHQATGTLLPFNVTDLGISAAAMMRGDAADGADPAVIAHLRDKFEFFGERPDERLDRILQHSLRQIFSRAGSDVRVFVMLANTFRLDRDGNEIIDEVFRHHNGVVAEIVAEFANVECLSPESFMTRAELRALRTPHHFDRIVYFRIFQHISQKLKREN